MKQLACEMCGGTDLIKQEGVFVCQNCETKYSVEDAKKMMVEGAVEVTGTVKVDSSANIDNFLKLAENAIKSENYKEAEDYCNRILEIETKNYTAWVIKGKAAGWQSTIANNRIDESITCFSKAFEFVPEDKRNDVINDVTTEIINLSNAMLSQSCNNFYSTPSLDTGITINSVCDSSIILAAKFIATCGIDETSFCNTAAKTISKSIMEAWAGRISREYSGNEYDLSRYAFETFLERSLACEDVLEYAITLSKNQSTSIQCYKDIICIKQKVLDSVYYEPNGYGGFSKLRITPKAQTEYINSIMEYHEKIKKLDDSHVIPERQMQKIGSCYVATAVYGSYDCPKVWTLRRYRDDALASTWYGRAFIRLYYATSPIIVKLFGKSAWFNHIFRKRLDILIEKLNAKEGVLDTPYNDK